MKYKFLILSIIVSSILISCSKDNSTNNINNNFDTVKICNQVWMKKNLDVDHYRNGDSIPEVRDSTQWRNLKTGAWCYYNNDSAIGAIYGKLYNWYAVNDPRGLAPTGWHIPSDSEWTILIDCLGGEKVAGGKMKYTGTIHWEKPNIGATNESGFSALPGGYRDYFGPYANLGLYSAWWSSTMGYVSFVWNRFLTSYSTNIGRDNSEKGVGFSVRCVKD